MATKNVTVTVEGGILIATWAAGDNTDVGKGVEVPYHANISVQVTGGTVGTSTLQGSQDNATWGALGAGLSLAASNAVTNVPEKARFFRPSFGAAASGAIVVLVATLVR